MRGVFSYSTRCNQWWSAASGVLPGYFVLRLVLKKGVINSQLIICTELSKYSSVFIRDIFVETLLHPVDGVVVDSCI